MPAGCWSGRGRRGRTGRERQSKILTAEGTRQQEILLAQHALGVPSRVPDGLRLLEEMR
jgi:hypothetical protein